MIRSTAFGGVLFALAMLASCDSKPSTPSPPATTAASDGTSKDVMGRMASPSPETSSASGSGTVTAMDITAGKVTLAHGPIPAVGWPAMTMAFAANPEVLKTVTVGDNVDFDINFKGGAGTVTSIRPIK